MLLSWNACKPRSIDTERMLNVLQLFTKLTPFNCYCNITITTSPNCNGTFVASLRRKLNLDSFICVFDKISSGRKSHHVSNRRIQ